MSPSPKFDLMNSVERRDPLTRAARLDAPGRDLSHLPRSRPVPEMRFRKSSTLMPVPWVPTGWSTGRCGS
jgi:hypothetical protein